MDLEPVRLAKRAFDPARAQCHRCEPLLVNPENTRPRLRWVGHRGMMALALQRHDDHRREPPPK
jgi:hypothetical protein